MSAPQDFGYPLLLCESFDQVLAREGNEITVEDIIDLTLRRGRLLMQAPGGAGKTWTLHRIQEAAVDSGYRVGFVQVQKLDQPDLEANGVDALLRAAEPRLTYEELGGGNSLLLLVDGLSEASSEIAELVLGAVDDWAALGPSTGTIVADRLTRRELHSRRWMLASMGPVSASTISAALGREVDGSELGFLSSPVNLAISMELPAGLVLNRSDAIAASLKGRASLSQRDWTKLEDLALRVYSDRRRRSFPSTWLAGEIEDAAAELLLRSGIIVNLSPDEMSFEHHLFHDYLAAQAASRRQEDWGHELFDVLTLRSSSQDSLVMLLELVSATQRPILIRRVYDWNLYAASYLLSKDRQVHGTTDETTEHQILALLGERRFDHFLATRRQVEDALILHGGPLATAYRQAGSAEQVVTHALGLMPDDPTYQAWLHTFARSETPSPISLVERMSDVDGVDGWTATNVVRRLGVDDTGRVAIEQLATSTSPVLRWRAVHALGVAGEPSRAVLMTALTTDPAVEVQFGALRSIVDQAYLCDSPELRTRIFQDLARQVKRILDEPRLSRELARVLFVDEPPLGWIDSVSIVLQAIVATETDPLELDKWRKVGSSFRERTPEPI